MVMEIIKHNCFLQHKNSSNGKEGNIRNVKLDILGVKMAKKCIKYIHQRKVFHLIQTVYSNKIILIQN